MNKTAIQTSLPHPPPEPLTAPDLTTIRTRHATAWHVLRRVLMPIASLRLTVVLFALSILLIFFGTLAQIDEGILTVQNKYFRTGIARIPLQVFVRFGQVFGNVSKTAEMPTGRFPFPGGWLLGGLLLTNLLAAHLVRFRLTWRRAGILVLHGGLVIMMLSEFVTGVYADESRMTIVEGESANYTEDPRACEFVVSHSLDSKMDDVVTVPKALLRKGGLISNADLPFDIQVEKFMTNSKYPEPAGPDNPATAGAGLQKVVQEQPEVSGTEDHIDVPAAYLTLKKKGSGESLGTYLATVYWSVENAPAQKVTVDGKNYDITLRWKRAYKPYTVELVEFKHEKYLGTNIPKNYASDIRLYDDEHPQGRPSVIYMNHPLRYNGESHWLLFKGETFYQADFLRDGRKGTVLQVVSNPGWLMPYISCALVSIGMLLHFGQNLIGFLAKRFAR